jgi:hypothetical protein
LGAELLEQIKGLHLKNKFIDNLYFELYFNKTNLTENFNKKNPFNNNNNSSSMKSTSNTNLQKLTSYLTISANAAIKQHNNFEYNLTNLISNTFYRFYLSARLNSLESSLAGPLEFETPSKFNFIFFFIIIY